MDPTGHSFWKKVGKFFRQWVAPVAAAVVAIVVFAAVTSVAGPIAGSFAASMASSATYNGISTFGANLERGRGFFESYGRGMLAYAATAVGGPIGGGAASAALVGGDPGRGAALGAVQAGFAVVGALLPPVPFPGSVLTNAAMAAGQGATGAAIVGGDPGQGAWRSAASAAATTIAMAIANGDFQQASDTGQSAGGATGKAVAEAQASQAGTAGATLRSGLLRRWVGEGPLTVDKSSWRAVGSFPGAGGLKMPGFRVTVLLERTVTYNQQGHFEYFDGAIPGRSFSRTWSEIEMRNVPGTVYRHPRTDEIVAVPDYIPSD